MSDWRLTNEQTTEAERLLSEEINKRMLDVAKESNAMNAWCLTLCTVAAAMAGSRKTGLEERNGALEPVTTMVALAYVGMQAAMDDFTAPPREGSDTQREVEG